MAIIAMINGLLSTYKLSLQALSRLLLVILITVVLFFLCLRIHLRAKIRQSRYQLTSWMFQQLLRGSLPSVISSTIKLVELYGSLSDMGALHDELTQASATAKEISKTKSSPDPQLSAELLSHLHQAQAEAVTFLNGTTEIGAWIELAETHLHLSDTPADQELS